MKSLPEAGIDRNNLFSEEAVKSRFHPAISRSVSSLIDHPATEAAGVGHPCRHKRSRWETSSGTSGTYTTMTTDFHLGRSQTFKEAAPNWETFSGPPHTGTRHRGPPRDRSTLPNATLSGPVMMPAADVSSYRRGSTPPQKLGETANESRDKRPFVARKSLGYGEAYSPDGRVALTLCWWRSSSRGAHKWGLGLQL